MRVTEVVDPAALLNRLTPGDNWLAQSARSLARLNALFLIAEDPQERLVGRSAATLAHQASLVRHVLTSTDLERVLIADEVGLGKTIEAGLIIKSLLDQQPGLRVLYLAPARLVRNVHTEFRSKLDILFRQFSADGRVQADIRSDPLVVASIHRAVHTANRDAVVGANPWDVIVVDECHHLSASKPGRQDANEQFALVRELIEKQPPNGRLLLMSGTPHQGNRTRFENLVSLLLHDGEDRSAISGRVIFRTKEDVRDWNGRPLFPKRDVRPPTVVTLGPEYQAWYNAIARLYDDVGGSVARRRASGWAKGQALQWAASSVEAGTGFLVRLAIRRLGWDLANSAVRQALESLRPYKGGSADEPIAALFDRVREQIRRQQSDDDDDDMEELDEEPWRPNASDLEAVLRQGVSLLQSPAASGKWRALRAILDEAPNEKVVLFAQPVETVGALRRFLELEYGEEPAVIIGGQSDDERDAQIAAFRRANGPRILVSSRAGGEGLNLQVSRRLVHIDVPWNPMELEQRVGRVHRFGSRRTIVVDTLVVHGTREVDAYRVAREKLAVAFGDLAHDSARFETLFARVMALVPPQEFEEVLGHSAPGPITEQDRERVGNLIEEGLRRWREFHAQFASQQESIRALDPGLATWDDLVSFLVDRCGAESVDGCSVPDFAESGGEIVVSNVPVRAVRIDGTVSALGDLRGDGATAADGTHVPMIGINSASVSQRLRDAFQPPLPCGAAWLRLAPSDDVTESMRRLDITRPFGLCSFVRQTIQASRGTATEIHVGLKTIVVQDGRPNTELVGDDHASMIRAVLRSTRQKEPVNAAWWSDLLARTEQETLNRLGRPSQQEFEAGVRHAVWPIFAAVVS
jgi:superfamily II DNA or RNA helicase